MTLVHKMARVGVTEEHGQTVAGSGPMAAMIVEDKGEAIRVVARQTRSDSSGPSHLAAQVLPRQVCRLIICTRSLVPLERRTATRRRECNA